MKFRSSGKIIINRRRRLFRVYLILWKFFKILWQTFYAIGQTFIVDKWQNIGKLIWPSGRTDITEHASKSWHFMLCGASVTRC